MESVVAPEEITSEQAESIAPESGFSVHLDNFDGPFDLLLQLISRHKLDITEISLSIVTDEFIAFIRALEASGEGWRLDQATEFLVIAATLLDLKAARLLPSGEIEDEEDLALLEARDILFARLLQYRAFKEISAIFSDRIDREEKSFARLVALEPHFAARLCEAAGLPKQAATQMHKRSTHEAIAQFLVSQTRAQLDKLASSKDIPLHTLPR